MKKSSVGQEDEGKSEETEAKDDTKDIRDKMTKVDVRSSWPANLPEKNVTLPSVARVKQLQESRPVNQVGSSSSGSATGNPRNKTALAPGHSLMDWIRLGNSGVDLTGVGGVPQIVTLSELAAHNKQNDAWIAIRGIVFNVTRYMDFHPGGVNELMRGVGKDATKLFDNVHGWVNYESILQKCVIGRLSRNSASATKSSPTEDTVPNTTNSTWATLNSITDCSVRNISQDTVSDAVLSCLRMDWRQTSQSITLFCKTVRYYAGVYYQLSRICDRKLVFKLFLESDVITLQLELTAEIEWPPVCTRNFDTMEVDFTFTKLNQDIWRSEGSQTMAREKNTNSRAYKEYEVLTNQQLSKWVHLLVVRAKDFLQVVPIGRHVEAKMSLNGTEVIRPYTPVPPCLHPDDMLPNYKSDCLCLMIKNYPKGTLSPSITALQTGQTLLLSNALGDFVIDDYVRFSVIHMLVGGTGLTPMLGIIQWALARRAVRSINLLNFNENEDNMFYAAELEKASADNKLKVTHILSKPKCTWTGRRGRISYVLLKELVGNVTADSCGLICGPPGFKEAVNKFLTPLGWVPFKTNSVKSGD